MENQLLKGYAYYIFKNEISSLNSVSFFASQITSLRPLYSGEGEIILTEKNIIIDGQNDIQISLGSLTQIYIGFDDSYRQEYVKNFGLFWQPLRLDYEEYRNSETLYLIIDYNSIFSHNQKWYNTLTQLLSE